MLMVTVADEVVELPPFGVVTEQETLLKIQPDGTGVSLRVYVWNAVMPLKALVFADVPSSTSEKFDRGDGLAVNEKLVAPFGVASLMIVMLPGKMTASAESERSWLPPEPSRATRAVW